MIENERRLIEDTVSNGYPNFLTIVGVVGSSNAILTPKRNL
jgi:hypothetical protein